MEVNAKVILKTSCEVEKSNVKCSIYMACLGLAAYCLLRSTLSDHQSCLALL